METVEYAQAIKVGDEQEATECETLKQMVTKLKEENN